MFMKRLSAAGVPAVSVHAMSVIATSADVEPCPGSGSRWGAVGYAKKKKRAKITSGGCGTLAFNPDPS